MLKRWLIYLASVVFGLALVGGLLVAFVFALLYPTLPTLEALTDYQPKIPLRIVSAEGELLGEFGEERRAVVKIRDVPEVMREAILAAPDSLERILDENARRHAHKARTEADEKRFAQARERMGPGEE